MSGQTGYSPGAVGGGVQARVRQTGGTQNEPAEPAAAAKQVLGAPAAHGGHQPAGGGGAAPAPPPQPRPDELPPRGSPGSQAASRAQVPLALAQPDGLPGRHVGIKACYEWLLTQNHGLHD